HASFPKPMSSAIGPSFFVPLRVLRGSGSYGPWLLIDHERDGPSRDRGNQGLDNGWAHPHPASSAAFTSFPAKPEPPKSEAQRTELQPCSVCPLSSGLRIGSPYGPRAQPSVEDPATRLEGADRRVPQQGEAEHPLERSYYLVDPD